MPRPACPKCGEANTSRRKREGLMQSLIYPRLGWYPWQCSVCQKVFVVKERGKSKRHPAAHPTQVSEAEPVGGRSNRAQGEPRKESVTLD